MKSFAGVALLGFMLSACTAGGTPMKDDTLEMFATNYTAAWNSGDPASVAAFFAEDGSLSVNGSPAVGREAITEEWTLGDDGLIAVSMGHFDAEDYQHQLEHGFDDGYP